MKKLTYVIKSKRFLYALLTSVLIYAFAIASSRFWKLLIPWRFIEIIIWFISYFTITGYVIFHWEDWFKKRFKAKVLFWRMFLKGKHNLYKYYIKKGNPAVFSYHKANSLSNKYCKILYKALRK